jgi:hypothetical protein
MALTVAQPTPAVNKGRDPGSPLFADIVNITGDASYVAGGYAADALVKASIGEGRTILAIIQLTVDPGATHATRYDHVNGKLLFLNAFATEETATTSTATFVAVPHLVLSY